MPSRLLWAEVPRRRAPEIVTLGIMEGDSPTRIEQLEERIDLLESYLRALQHRLDDDDRRASASTDRVATWNAPARASWPPPTTAQKPAAERRPFVLESEVVLKWGGVGLVVLAVGFAVSTAISRGWIGPELQLVGALAISTALIVAGLRLRTSRVAWTHALCSGGVLALFTTVASNLFIDETSDGVAFASTIAIGFIGAVLAFAIGSEWVGAANLLGGVIGWFVIADGEPPLVASSSWIVAILAATIAISLRHRWQAARLLAHAVGLAALIGLAAEPSDALQRCFVLGAAAVVAMSLARVPSIGDLTSIWQQLEVQLVIGAAPWSVGVIALGLDLDSDNTVGVAAIAVAGGTVVVALGMRRWISAPHVVSLLIGASVALSIGLAVLLSTSIAFTALAVQGAGLAVLSRSLGDNLRIAINAAIVLLVSGVFALDEMFEAWVDDARLSDDLAHLAIVVAIAFALWQARPRVIRQLGAILVLAFALVWLGSVLVHLPQGQAAVSVSWAIVGTAVLVVGAIRKAPEVGGVGLAVLALTVGKLLTVDLQEVDTLWRAGLFFIVGVGFLRLGFLLPGLMGRSSESSADGAHDVDHDGRPVGRA